MKPISTTLLMLFVAVTLFGQSDIKISEKKNNTKFKYVFLPDLPGYETYSSATITAADGFGINYSVIGNMAKPTEGQIQMGANYFQQVSLKDFGDFKIELTRTNHNVLEKELLVLDEKITKSDGSTVVEKRHNYQLNFNDTYQIVVKDSKNGDKVILEKELVVNDFSIFPKDYQNGATGYGNDKLLNVAYERAVLENVELGTPKGQILRLKEHYASLFNGIKVQIQAYLEQTLMKKNDSFVVYTSSYKTKEEKFALLDSAATYFYNGMDLMNENFKTGNSINFHDKSVSENFSNAYRIYSQYAGDEFSAMLSEKDKAEYISAMKLNLFYSALLSSKFKEATDLFEATGKEAKVDMDKKNADVSSGKLGNQISGGFGQLTRSQDQKDFDRMEILFEMFKHELKNYDVHKVYYNFYK